MSALILLTVFGIIVLYLGFANNKALLAPVAITGLVISMILSLKDWGLGSKYFHDMMIIDNFSIAFNVSMLIITILIFLFGINYYLRMEHHVAEQYALMIFALTGAFLMTSFSNLIMLFLGIEILSIPLYILAGGIQPYCIDLIVGIVFQEHGTISQQSYTADMLVETCTDWINHFGLVGKLSSPCSFKKLLNIYPVLALKGIAEITNRPYVI